MGRLSKRTIQCRQARKQRELLQANGAALSSGELGAAALSVWEDSKL
jgi:hypothetical protein